MVETVPATSAYLDNYFWAQLRRPSVDWASILRPPLTCRVPTSNMTDGATITCAPMFATNSSSQTSVLALDYPTFKCAHAQPSVTWPSQLTSLDYPASCCIAFPTDFP